MNIYDVYSWCHISALETLSHLDQEGLTDQEWASIALAILADEAFDLHFLENCFAIGHFA